MRAPIKGLVYASLLATLCGRLDTGLAQAADPRLSDDAVPVRIKADDFRDPKPTYVPVPLFPAEQSGEGWVVVSMMVDPKGQPYEVGVVGSTGNKVFEQLAVRSMERARFTPATVNAAPIEGSYEFRYTFQNARLNRGAQSGFINAYKSLEAALKARDRAAASAAIRQLKITTLYESAYYGVAVYGYEALWGNESQQVAALECALGGQDYLPLEQQRSLLLANFHLQFKRHDYRQVLQMWDRLRKADVDKATLAKLQPVMEDVQRLRNAGGAYTMSGTIPDFGAWTVQLFRQRFSAEISTGAISQVKLKCARRFVSFAFSPGLEHAVPESYGDCRLILEGTPGTQLTLTQS